jgi:hypothetical protein
MSNSWAGTSRIFAYARDRSTLIMRTRSATQVVPFPDVGGRYGNCAVYAARSVVALVSCFGPGADGADPYLVRFGGAPVRVAGGQPWDLYLSLGRYWLGGSDCTYEPWTSCTSVSLNIRSGERLTRAVDLNRSDPSPPPPVRRFPRFSGALWLPGKGTGNDLVLHRSRHSALRLDGCRDGCANIAIHGHSVIWQRHVRHDDVAFYGTGALYARDLRCGRLTRFAVPDHRPIRFAGFALGGIWAQTKEPGKPYATGTLGMARLPRC